jgi:hypothetical protein
MCTCVVGPTQEKAPFGVFSPAAQLSFNVMRQGCSPLLLRMLPQSVVRGVKATGDQGPLGAVRPNLPETVCGSTALVEAVHDPDPGGIVDDGEHGVGCLATSGSRWGSHCSTTSTMHGASLAVTTRTRAYAQGHGGGSPERTSSLRLRLEIRASYLP